MRLRVIDQRLAEEGRKKIEYAENHMRVLVGIRERFRREKPLKGVRIGACLHVTKETAALIRTLRDGGAEIWLCASNPLSTQDDVAAALNEEDVNVFARRGMDTGEYYQCIHEVMKSKPQLVIDDGADLIATIHKESPNFMDDIICGMEETTTGVIRLKAMERDGKLRFPVIAVNDARSKNMFDNFYGTGESALHGILRATNILIPGKKVVIAGYGQCGKGVARMARELGAHTIVCEVNPIEALRAYYDGHDVMRMDDASKVGDVFITVTGCKGVIREEHIMQMKDGAILCNAGHFDVEIDVKRLREIAKSRRIRENVEEFLLENGRRIFLLGEGRLVNLVCAEGHPSEVMDQSFSLQALCAEYAVKHGRLEPRVHQVPPEIDEEVARLKLESLGVKIDELTEEQRRYLSGWREGT